MLPRVRRPTARTPLLALTSSVSFAPSIDLVPRHAPVPGLAHELIVSWLASFNQLYVVSAFGSTEAPTSSGFGAAATANTMAAWVKTYGVDGIE